MSIHKVNIILLQQIHELTQPLIQIVKDEIGTRNSETFFGYAVDVLLPEVQRFYYSIIKYSLSTIGCNSDIDETEED